MLGEAFVKHADPRRAVLMAEMLALLEPLPPSPELVAVLTELADVEALAGRPEIGLRHAERALALAERARPRPAAAHPWLPGPEPPRLGDRGALDDFREAMTLATEAGQGRRRPSSYNNLGARSATFEGLAAPSRPTGRDRVREGPRARPRTG